MNTRYKTYKGYDVSEWENDPQVRRVLGEELPEKTAEEKPLGEFGSDEPPALMDNIPAGSDDRAIRLPLPAADWSLLEASTLPTGDDS